MGISSSTSRSMSNSARALSSLLGSGDDGGMGAQHHGDATPSGAAVMEDARMSLQQCSGLNNGGEGQSASFTEALCCTSTRRASSRYAGET